MVASPARIGAHMSTAGGLHRALERGAEHGCPVVQLFAAPSRRWKAAPLTEDDLAAWAAARAATGVEALAHASYLINLAAPAAAGWEQACAALGAELDRCARLGIPLLVLHPGAHLEAGEAAGLARIARAVDRVFADRAPGGPRLLFENTAGQGTCLGHRLEHLRDLLGLVADPARVGFCLDTAHTLAAGYDVATAAGWEETAAAVEGAVGWSRVLAVHVNDSKRPLGSRVDRHEHVGRGHLGLAALARILTDPRLAGRPLLLETPKPTPHADPVNLAILTELTRAGRVTPRARRLAARPLDRPLHPAPARR